MKYGLVFCFLIVGILAFPQGYPENYFKAPIDGKLILSGNFGELRSDHFHSGLDFKTKGKIGASVYASADGYVARIKISVNGFGKAIYIKHPNGYTTVYAHLHKFNPRIEAFVRKAQYAKESFEIELFPGNSLQVKKGEVIAFSGNTGGSGGPHLHYEIRDSKSEKPINPALFGFEIKDFIRPKIKALKVYPLQKGGTVDGNDKACIYNLSGWGLGYTLKEDSIIKVSGRIGLGINAYDLMNDSYNKIGIYEISAYLDSSLIHKHQLERFSFYESKYINSFIDYAQYKTSKTRFQRTQKDPGNRLSIYEDQKNEGIIHLSDTLIHKLTYIIKDVHGNQSKLRFYLKADSLKKAIDNNLAKIGSWFDYETANQYDTDEIQLEFKKGSFYNSFSFNLDSSDYAKEAFSKVFHIHSNTMPVHKAYTLRIKLDSIPEHLKSKVFIANLEDDEIEHFDSELEQEYLKARVKRFGKYVILADTVKPKIKAINIHHNKKISVYKRVVFEIEDELSGISSYRATLNNKWILCEYDKKTKRLVYEIDDHMKKGVNDFLLVVKDELQNSNSFSAKLHF